MHAGGTDVASSWRILPPSEAIPKPLKPTIAAMVKIQLSQLRAPSLSCFGFGVARPLDSDYCDGMIWIPFMVWRVFTVPFGTLGALDTHRNPARRSPFLGPELDVQFMMQESWIEGLS